MKKCLQKITKKIHERSSLKQELQVAKLKKNLKPQNKRYKSWICYCNRKFKEIWRGKNSDNLSKSSIIQVLHANVRTGRIGNGTTWASIPETRRMKLSLTLKKFYAFIHQSPLKYLLKSVG